MGATTIQPLPHDVERPAPEVPSGTAESLHRDATDSPPPDLPALLQALGEDGPEKLEGFLNQLLARFNVELERIASDIKGLEFRREQIEEDRRRAMELRDALLAWKCEQRREREQAEQQEAAEGERRRKAWTRVDEPAFRRCVAKLGKFTRQQLAARYKEETGQEISMPTITRYLDELVELGIARDTGERRKSVDAEGKRRGRAAIVYEYVRPTDEGAAARFSRQHRGRGDYSSGVAATPRSSGKVVAGTGRAHRITDKEIKRMIQAAVAAGWEYEPGPHHKLRKGRDLVVLPNTPSDVRGYANSRSLLRRYGVDV